MTQRKCPFEPPTEPDSMQREDTRSPIVPVMICMATHDVLQKKDDYGKRQYQQGFTPNTVPRRI
jgi:hypothetical protein